MFKHLLAVVVFSFTLIIGFQNAALAEWRWSATDLSGSYNGTAPNKEQAEAEMRAACQNCQYFTKETFGGDGNYLQFSYLPDPEWLDADYADWEYMPSIPGGAPRFASLGGLINWAKGTLISSPQCTDTYTTLNSSSWINYYTLPVIPPTAELLCSSPVDTGGNTFLCNDLPLTVHYSLYNDVEKTCYNYTYDYYVSRLRTPSCPSHLTNILVYFPEDGAPTSQSLVCKIRYSGSVYAPLHDSECDFETNTKVGNPCSPMTGAKLKSGRDYSGQNLSFTRQYNSIRIVHNSNIGKNWRHNYDDTLFFDTNEYVRGWMSGGNTYVRFSGNVPPYLTNIPISPKVDRVIGVEKVELLNNEWHLIFDNGDARIFSLTGVLLRLETHDGKTTTLSYTDDKLMSVTNHFGHQLQFLYQDDLISEVIQPDGQSINYSYDSIGNLITVTYPDTGQGNGDTITYHYEDTRFPFHLTGITDENGDRHQTYTYNADGKVITSEKAQTTNTSPQELFQLDYQN